MKLEIQKWLTDFSGCSGGNIGSKENPSIWLCGIEYGGGWDEEGLRFNIYEEKWENNPQFGHLEFDNHPYTQILYKLLLCTRQKISTNQFSWVWGLKN